MTAALPVADALQCVSVDSLGLLWNRRAFDCQLLPHVVAGQQACASSAIVGVYVDEANVAGLSLCNGVAILHRNVAFPSVPQVMSWLMTANHVWEISDWVVYKIFGAAFGHFAGSAYPRLPRHLLLIIVFLVVPKKYTPPALRIQ